MASATALFGPWLDSSMRPVEVVCLRLIVPRWMVEDTAFIAASNPNNWRFGGGLSSDVVNAGLDLQVD
jgi:hypothetical protein